MTYTLAQIIAWDEESREHGYKRGPVERPSTMPEFCNEEQAERLVCGDGLLTITVTPVHTLDEPDDLHEAAAWAGRVDSESLAAMLTNGRSGPYQVAASTEMTRRFPNG